MWTEETPLVFALSETQALAAAICAAAGWSLSPLQERTFEAGEFLVRPLQSVRNRDVLIIESLAGTPELPPGQRLTRLLFLLAALRDGGAASCTALIPYLAFARKDRRTQPRDAVNTRYVAQLLESVGLNHLMLLDVHNPAAIDNAYRLHVDHFTALPMLAAEFVHGLRGQSIVVVSPDMGGLKRAQVFRHLLERRLKLDLEIAFIAKHREHGVLTGDTIIGHVNGRSAVLVDDLCASGATLLRAARALRRAGAIEVSAALTHAPLLQGIAGLCESGHFDRILLTDSVGRSIDVAASMGACVTTIPVAPLFGCALRRLRAGLPLAPLLSEWPVSSDN